MNPEKKTCRACGGSGMHGYAEDAPCPTCHGKGYASEEDYRLAYLIKYGSEEEAEEQEDTPTPEETQSRIEMFERWVEEGLDDFDDESDDYDEDEY